MESTDFSSQEKLDQLLHDGKINHQEYDRLRNSLMRGSGQTETNRPEEYLTKLPWQIWVVIALLALEGIGNLMAIPRMPIAAVWLAAKCILIVGLLKGWKPVFVLAVILTAIHALFFLFVSPVVALLNAILLILLMTARGFYFPQR